MEKRREKRKKKKHERKIAFQVSISGMNYTKKNKMEWEHSMEFIFKRNENNKEPENIVALSQRYGNKYHSWNLHNSFDTCLSTMPGNSIKMYFRINLSLNSQ